MTPLSTGAASLSHPKKPTWSAFDRPPGHETDFTASPSTAHCRGAAGSHGCRPSLRGGLQGRRLTSGRRTGGDTAGLPARPADLSVRNG